jgi:FeS assembly protein IscX
MHAGGIFVNRPASLSYNEAMPGLTWNHTEDIALSLYEAHPDVDPTNIRFTDLHKWITQLADFKDDPMASTEGKLEAIQMAWLEEYQENQ